MDDVDLVIFDCDGVLIDSEVISARTLILTLAQHGVAIDASYVAAHFLGRAFPAVPAAVLRDFGVTLPDTFERIFRAELTTAFQRDLRAIPHAETVLRGLTLPWCVATSSNRARATTSLAVVGFTDLVGDRLFTGDMVARGKPAPDLFLLAARQMGASPGRCLVIEDSPTGIAAARAAGMRVWHFHGGSHLAGLDIGALDADRKLSCMGRFHDGAAA
ncbi:HAD family hydrolase [Falsirhodobacter halotolerans]|uniref:HAD family hydrolase n=1 Tax=Falsirhodobacter halotolerans TaxID=1146892 RepID=UPI001FD2D159|nr:HAD family hydrolase [Falsirhodobacter halotolerans]MCJ8139709.1 HAD family hydrolase [Falsirhodobacter halotolerans]